MLEGELWLAAIWWVVRKYKWVIGVKGVKVYLQLPELISLFKQKEIHPHAKFLLLDLELYRVTFHEGRGAWAYSNALIEASPLQSGLEVLEDDGIEGPLIRKPGSRLPAKLEDVPMIKIYFDGGCRKGSCAFGYVLFD